MKINWHNLHDVLPRGTDGEKILAVVRDYVNEYERELVSAQVVSEVLADEALRVQRDALWAIIKRLALTPADDFYKPGDYMAGVVNDAWIEGGKIMGERG